MKELEQGCETLDPKPYILNLKPSTLNVRSKERIFLGATIGIIKEGTRKSSYSSHGSMESHILRPWKEDRSLLCGHCWASSGESRNNCGVM